MKIIRLSSGLGNQMFMYAFFKHIEKKYKEPVFFDDKFFKTDRSGRKPEISILYNYDPYKFKFNPAGERRIKRIFYKTIRFLFPKFKYVKEKDYNDEKWYNGDVYFNGYWQTCKYADQFGKKIFLPSGEIPLVLQDIEEKIKDSNCPICIHFRRGDYFSPLYVKRYGVCSVDYYEKAIDTIESMLVNEQITYFVFSDDINWVKKNISFTKETVYIPNHPVNSIWYIKLMSLCKHNVISNSTFSWWGAYLNSNCNKIVIGPDKWTFDKQTNPMCDNWLKINV